MGTALTRKYKTEWMQTQISVADKLGQSIDPEKLVASFCIFFGSERRTALQILEQLILTNFVKRWGKDLLGPKTFEAQLILERDAAKQEKIADEEKECQTNQKQKILK
jgi:hypothetical protein